MRIAARVARLESRPRLRPHLPGVPPWPAEAILDTPEIIDVACELRTYLRRGEPAPAELVGRFRRLRAEHEAALNAKFGVG